MNPPVKQKILIATGLYPPDIGGPATYSKLLMDELPARGIEPRLVSFGEVRNLPKLLRHLVYFFKVLNRAQNTELIYAQDPMSVGVPAMLAAKLSGKKFILKIVGDYAWEQARQRFGVTDLLDDFQTKQYGWRAEMFRKIERKVAQSADQVVVPSEYLKKIIAGWGVPEGRIKVIYNSVEVGEVGIDKNEARKTLGLSGNLILSVGRLAPWKGFSTLIELMPELLLANPDFKLVIVGEGPELGKLIALGEKLKVEGTLILTGKLSHQKTLQYMRAADMLVLNTGYEGLPHVVVEAMQLGLPVITTRVGGNPEVIDHNRTGILVEYDNKKELKEAVLNFWNNRELAAALAAAAQSEARQKFSKGGMLDGIVKLLVL